MKNRLLAAASAVAIAAVATPAHAALSLLPLGNILAPLNVAAADPNAAVGPLGFAPNVIVQFGGQVASTGGTFLAEFLGSEAAAINTFITPGGVLTNVGNQNNFSLAGFSSVVFNAGAGLLPFSFTTTVGGGEFLNNLDGVNPIDVTPLSNGLNFASIFVGDALYLFLDDRGGSTVGGLPDDDNHDDMVIRLTEIPIPEPASLALLGFGLLGLGAVARRRADPAGG